MKTNVQALKDLYVKLGGSLADTYSDIADGAAVSNYVTISDMIEACSKVAGGGGSALPEVTGSDNGDVLTVVEGAWAKAAPSAELPAVTGSDNGDVLTVVEGAWAKAAPSAELPAVTGSDNGEVLMVVEGAWAKGNVGEALMFTITKSGGKYTSSVSPADIYNHVANGGLAIALHKKTNAAPVLRYFSQSFLGDNGYGDGEVVFAQHNYNTSYETSTDETFQLIYYSSESPENAYEWEYRSDSQSVAIYRTTGAPTISGNFDTIRLNNDSASMLLSQAKRPKLIFVTVSDNNGNSRSIMIIDKVEDISSDITISGHIGSVAYTATVPASSASTNGVDMTKVV